MFAKFKYEPLPIGDINLDDKNPRIVVQKPLAGQDQIVEYLLEHEDLVGFIRKIAQVGKNKGAERPYVVKKGSKYTVVEGNTRIAAYKILAGLLKIPENYENQIPFVSDELKSSLLVVDCAIAPNRDSLLPIMAESHFGVGDKSKWGYLGSRKALTDEHAAGKSIAQLAKAFGISQAQVLDYLIEYQLYLESLQFDWSDNERNKLLDPNVQFNPPVRFLQGKGHKEAIGITYDRPNLKIIFKDNASKGKFRHLIQKLIISTGNGLGATSAYVDVFKDYDPPADEQPGDDETKPVDAGGSATGSTDLDDAPVSEPISPTPPQAGGPKLKNGALYNYPVKQHSNLLKQLMREAGKVNAKQLPAASTFLLRNLLEALLKHIVEQSGANPDKKSLSLEDALNLCRSKAVPLSADDKKVLKDFQGNHLNYVNLGSHGNVIPHPDRVFQIRDLLDQFIRKNI